MESEKFFKTRIRISGILSMRHSKLELVESITLDNYIEWFFSKNQRLYFFTLLIITYFTNQFSFVWQQKNNYSKNSKFAWLDSNVFHIFITGEDLNDKFRRHQFTPRIYPYVDSRTRLPDIRPMHYTKRQNILVWFGCLNSPTLLHLYLRIDFRQHICISNSDSI